MTNKDILLNEETVEMSIVPSTISQVSMVGKDLDLISLGKVQDDGLGKHTLCATKDWGLK